MDFLNQLDRNTLVICDNNFKEKVLEYLNNTPKLYSINFMTINELIKRYYFDYDEKTIYYLMKKYKLKYDVAEKYLKNIYFVEDKKYSSDKLNILVKYKQELIDNNLLIYDELFEEYIKNRDVVVINCDLNKFQKNIINNLKKTTNVKIIDKNYNNYSHKVLEFNTLYDEIEYVAYKICELIETGIDINDIKISNINEEYINPIKRIFGFYNIPINLNSNQSIYSTKIVKEFLNNYNSNIEVTISALEKYKGNDIYNKIIDVCNKYRWIDDYNKIKDLIIHDLKRISIKHKKLNKAINLVDYKDITISDKYVFLMNFNLGVIPKIYKDEDYINDRIKPSYLENTVEKNCIEKEITINSINNIKNLTITYKKKSPTNVYYPSNLVELYELSTDSININKSYSIINDKIKLSNYLDKLVKYGIKDKNLSLLSSNYEIPYLNYSNNYENINKKDLHEYINNKLTLSYTKLEEYNECSFKYYLSNILNLNIFKDNFAAILGSVFHHILEKGLKKPLDIHNEINLFIKRKYKDREFSNKEKFFLKKTEKDMQFVIDTIKKQMVNCKLDNILTEQEVIVHKNSDLKVIFKGFIDKILYKEIEGNTIVAIIDYKTGPMDVELGYLPYGLHLQLPIYLYLANNMNFKNVKFAGIYLQKVMPSIEKIDFKNKTKRETKLKLEGYSTTNREILSQFDISYKDSEVIKSMSEIASGDFGSYAKVLSEDKFNTLIDLTNKEIDKCINNIENAKFDINPKMEENAKEITACQYCKYKDICFREQKDIKRIKKDKELSYLGGENDD